MIASDTATAPLATVRELARYVQCFDDALTPELCEHLIDSYDRLAAQQSRNGRGFLTGLEASAWTELNVTRAGDGTLQDFFLGQVVKYLALYNERVPHTLPVPLRMRIENLRIKQYSVEAGDRFQPHFDALDHFANRYLVFLWYLNDVADGGETEFVDLGLRIAARRGRLVMFPPYWMFQHAGLAPRSNDKFILSTYLLF